MDDMTLEQEMLVVTGKMAGVVEGHEISAVIAAALNVIGTCVSKITDADDRATVVRSLQLCVGSLD